MSANPRNGARSLAAAIFLRGAGVAAAGARRFLYLTVLSLVFLSAVRRQSPGKPDDGFLPAQLSLGHALYFGVGAYVLGHRLGTLWPVAMGSP